MTGEATGLHLEDQHGWVLKGLNSPDLIAQTNYVDNKGEVLDVKQYAAAPPSPNK